MFKGVKMYSDNRFSVSTDNHALLISQEIEKGKNIIFFNGEIYNKEEINREFGIKILKNTTFEENIEFVYHIIQLKGLEAIKKINGQFIIIYADFEARKVYIINDHLCIRQLYYYQGKNIFLFGSEIKFLLFHPECPKEIDWETSLKRPQPTTVVSCFNSYKTYFKDVNLLPEASILQIDTTNCKTKLQTYFHIDDFQNYDFQADKRTSEEVIVEYFNLLKDSIHIRAKKMGTTYSLLSGGLDSSAIAALCSKYHKTETFSILTQSTYTEGYTDLSRKLAKHLKLKNTQFLIPVHEIIFNTDLWKQWIWRIESPINHIDSLTKTLLHFAIGKKRPEVKGVLTGTGSDQLNGGLARWMAIEGQNEDESWKNFHDSIIEVENRKLINNPDGDLWNFRNFINRDYLKFLSGKETEKNSWQFYMKGALHSELYSLRWDEMRASNYYGHETHFPFLDYRFIELIAKIPPRLHKDLFYDKQILRKPFEGMLPDYIINKPKAPGILDEYDFRFKLFDFLTNDSIFMEEALSNENLSVVNKTFLLDRIHKMKEIPEIYEWNNIMHLLNLGLLEKMAGKTEKEMEIETFSGEPFELNFKNEKQTKIFLDTRLCIKNKFVILHKPLKFMPDCSLLFDKLNNTYYLSRSNVMVFEIEPQYKDWLKFLIDYALLYQKGYTPAIST
ncbi:MAG: asparagine synthase-related protein, partial [Bacteroidota bacterium]